MRETELILNSDGSIYHLALHPGELAKRIFFVGDQDRVEKVGQYFDDIEFVRRKREFCTLTGSYLGDRISVISTGIGTDNIDIVWNEIDALFNLSFSTRYPNARAQRLKVIRLGTCGGMQADVPVDSLVLSAYALGADGLMPFYDVPPLTGRGALFEHQWQTFLQATGLNVNVYAAQGSRHLTKLVEDLFPNILTGITFTANGFYGPQGRTLGRVSVKWPNLPERLATFALPEQKLRVLNMEMETAGILGLGRALGHEAGSLSVILANRGTGKFSETPAASVDYLIRTGLEVMRNWQ
ncbi:MAG: nucleoside phosphorylase [Bacteroidota bacterium]